MDRYRNDASLQDVATKYDLRITKKQFRDHMSRRDDLVRAKAIEYLAETVRSAGDSGSLHWAAYMEQVAALLRERANR